jgi:hypothetical protein
MAETICSNIKGKKHKLNPYTLRPWLREQVIDQDFDKTS